MRWGRLPCAIWGSGALASLSLVATVVQGVVQGMRGPWLYLSSSSGPHVRAGDSTVRAWQSGSQCLVYIASISRADASVPSTQGKPRLCTDGYEHARRPQTKRGQRTKIASRSTPRRIATHPRPSPTLSPAGGSVGYAVIAPWLRPTWWPAATRIGAVIGPPGRVCGRFGGGACM